jgi:hypothetical protein
MSIENMFQENSIINIQINICVANIFLPERRIKWIINSISDKENKSGKPFRIQFDCTPIVVDITRQLLLCKWPAILS